MGELGEVIVSKSTKFKTKIRICRFSKNIECGDEKKNMYFPNES